MKIFSLLYRRIINARFRGQIQLGRDTNIRKRNFDISSGNIKICDGVTVRNGTFFSVAGGVIEVGNNVFFNRNCIVASHKHIMIGKNTIFGPNVCIYDHNHKFSKAEGIKKNEFSCSDVVIGDGCWIGANVVILKGTHLGNNSVVAAGTVLQGCYPNGTLIRNRKEIQTELIY